MKATSVKARCSTSVRFVCTICITLWLVAPGIVAEEARFFRIVGPAATTVIGFSANGHITWTNAVTNVTCTVQTAVSLAGPSDWEDYTRVPVSNHVITLWLWDPNPPTNMALIPAGSFTMGNCMDPAEGFESEVPLHTVYVSAVYMDRYEVTKALWDEVKAWHAGNGYSYQNPGSGKAATHPVQTVNWRDCVKWCNARSQKEGLTPCYYTNSNLTGVYKTGQVEPYVNWQANGYRLPTEAEWEKAARAGPTGHRFPWWDADTIDLSHATDTIDWSRANYNAVTSTYNYDVNQTDGHNPIFNDGVYPYTSPVGFFAANGYGLYDMAGNVFQWCWDWYDPLWYSNTDATQNDTHGPVGSPYGFRVRRGGSWDYGAYNSRCAVRFPNSPALADYCLGFRCVRGL